MLSEELEGKVTVDDDLTAVLADGGFQEAVFVALRRSVRDVEEPLDSTDAVDEVVVCGLMPHAGIVSCCFVDAFVQQFDELLYGEAVERPAI